MDKLSNEILTFLLDNSDSMISIIDNKMRYVNVNESFCKSFRVQKNDLIGKCPSELWGENTYREKIRKNIERSLKGEKIQYRAFFDIADSSGKFYEVTYRPFKSSSKKLSYTIIETRDVSTEVKNNEKLPHKYIKYDFMDKYLPFGIFSCNRDGLIIEANETFYNILEVDQDQREGLNFNDLMKVDHRFSEHIRSGKEGEAGTFGQMQMVTIGGRELFVRISSHVREDNQNRNIIDGTLEDVTREVILERRLYQSHRLETLGTLAGGVAHDFNTILTTISGYSDMTMEEVESDSVIYKYMTRLKSAVNKAGSIIDQMLVFSKQLDQHVVALEVDKIIKEAVEFIRSSVPDNITLKTKYNKIDGLVYADPTQLFRVFLNIMTNALHAMEDGGGTMTVSLSESSTDNKQYADISVADTGTGIDPSIIDRIFEPFFTSKEVDKGTGMGLSVSHGIITGIGGEINVESNPGEGSVFTLRMPLKELRTQSESESDKQPGNILFAHDNMYLSRTLSLALERMGFKVTLISSARDIRKIIENNLSDNDILFIVNKFADKKIFDLLAKKKKEGISFRVNFIMQKDTIEDKIPVYSNNREFGIVYEPVTLKDILSKLN